MCAEHSENSDSRKNDLVIRIPICWLTYHTLYVQSSISNNVTALHISSRLGSPIHKSGHKLVSFVQILSYSQQSVDASGVRMTEHLRFEEGTSGRIKFCAERSSERSCIEGEMPSVRSSLVICNSGICVKP